MRDRRYGRQPRTAPADVVAVAERQGGRGIAESALQALVSRTAIAAVLGQSFGGLRDLYEALGYNKAPLFRDFLAKYVRQDIAAAVVDAPVQACWGAPPEISESEDNETEFEKAWADLLKRRNVLNYFQRVDTLQSIGEYAVLLMGFDGEADLSKPVANANQLLYLMPYSQDAATISTYDGKTTSPRFGLPETYSINMRSAGSTLGTPTAARPVHWSRVIHVTEDNLDDDVRGQPKLLRIMNRLDDIDKVAGGSAEMFWRGAQPGHGFSVQKDANLSPDKKVAFQTEIANYMHGLQRDLLLEGIDITNLAQQIADPTGHVSVLIDLLAGAVRIPKRILLGSERGELSSAQDERAWQSRIMQRQRQFCEPMVLRPFIDRLIEHGTLPKPADGYTCKWPDQFALSGKEKAKVAALPKEKKA